MLAVLAGLAAACLLAGWAPAAHADGDPASDVLAAQPAFVPADAGISPTQSAQLTQTVAAAVRAGYPIRVALVANPADLGSVSRLWGRPQAYASFLGQELSLVYRGVLLVVMPGGLGIFHVGAGTPPPVPRALVSLRPGRELAGAATTAVRALAAADGHVLPAASVVVRPTAGGSALGSVDAGSWLALATGAILIGAAWAWSLRARPPREPPPRAVG